MQRSPGTGAGGSAGVLRRLRRRRRGRRRAFRAFRFWARRLAGRLALALVAAAVLQLFTATVSAQTPPANIGQCVRTSSAAAQFQPGGDFDPAGPPRGGAFTPPNSLLYAAVECAKTFAVTTMVPIGMNIWGGLAIIITVWTGIQMMFAGGFAIGEVVSLVLLLGFPFAVLTFYDLGVGTPWGNFDFIDMVTGAGQNVAADLVDGALETFQDTVFDTVSGLWATETQRAAGDAAEDSSGDAAESPGLVARVWGWISSPVSSAVDAVLAPINRFLTALLRTVVVLVLGLILLVLLVVPALVAYCSYLWGYMGLLVAVILGPVLIPWILVPQLQFLAWGWFRTLLGAAVHMMVAGATFAVVAQILTIPMVRFGVMLKRGDEAGVGLVTNDFVSASLGALGVGFDVIVESLPLIVVAFLGAFKIGEITAMIMNGGSMPGSGLGDRMSSMRNMRGLGRSGASVGRGLLGGGGAGAGRLAAGGVVAGPPGVAVAAGAMVLSQATRSR